MICDRSGLTYRRSEMVQEPKTGLWVHKSEVDPPHPQQYRTPIHPDRQSVYPVRPRAFARAAGGFEANPTLVALGYVPSHQALPDGTTSTLPEIQGGAIDDAATNFSFIDTNDVDPTTF